MLSFLGHSAGDQGHARRCLALAIALVANAGHLGAGSQAHVVARVWAVADGDVRVQCRLTPIGGSFDATTSAMSGRLVPQDSGVDANPGELVVDLTTLETGIALRDSHLRERYLEVGRGPGFERAILSAIQLDGAVPSGADQSVAPFSGTLLLHGVTRRVTGLAELRSGDRRLTVQATFAINVADFEIPTPRYLGVGVRDEVEISVTFEATDVTSSEREVP